MFPKSLFFLAKRLKSEIIDKSDYSFIVNIALPVWREALLTRFDNRGQFRTWLAKQPREVAVVFAARAALRILPVVRTAKYGGFSGILILPVFRAAVISWIGGKYPARETELIAAAAYAYAAAVAAASDVASTIAYADAAAIRSAASADVYAALGAIQDDAVVNTAYATAVATRAADSYAAVGATRAAASAARAAATRGADAYAAVGAVRAADCAAAYADDAAYAAAYSDARTYAIAAGEAEPGDAAHAGTYAGAAATPYFWSALSIDATHLEKGATASVIAASPLWPKGQPQQLQSLWHEMKAALLAEGQNWQVWTIWYDDRLDGRIRQEDRELAYVRVDATLWNRSPALVNAEIVRRIGEN